MGSRLSSMLITILIVIYRCSAFLSFNDEPEQYLVTAVLRPGNASEKHGVVVGLLQRLVDLVRTSFPKATIKLRLDGGFAFPQMFAYLDSVPRLQYVCGMAKNAVLEREAEPLLASARQLAQLTNQSAPGLRRISVPSPLLGATAPRDYQSGDRFQPARRAQR
jgi:Transposase DDE domain group 1